MRFRDRRDAGRQLAERLGALDLTDAVVLALPRGGIPVAAEIANRLHLPLEVFVACKVRAAEREELGLGAVAEGSDELVVGDVARALGIDQGRLDDLAEPARREVARRVDVYRGERLLPPVGGRDVVLVDDGLATGVTTEAALRALRHRRPRRLVLAAPVGAAATVARLATVADEVVCLLAPPHFLAVGEWYDDFRPTSDAEVIHALAGAERGAP
jgi:putative phosphoribosyl transferase